jgi:primosomal protein N' (replication factor Y)
LSFNIAKVVIDSPLPHLDRLFDYLIPDNLLGEAKPGVRVRVPFRNRRVEGFIVAITDKSELTGKLTQLENVVSSEVVLTPEISKLGRITAQRTVGNFHDVLRAAIPPRHARAEKRTFEKTELQIETNFAGLEDYPGMIEFLQNKEKSIAVVDIPLSQTYAKFICQILNTGMKNVLILVPDQFDIDLVMHEVEIKPAQDRIAILTSQQTAEQRYIEFLKVLRGAADLIIGTRSAIFAPIPNLDLILMFDDGDDLYTSPQAPYWNARDVALWRNELFNDRIIFAARAQSAEAAMLLDSNSAVHIESIQKNRTDVPRLSGDNWTDQLNPLTQKSRFPDSVFEVIRNGLRSGTVLVSVARKGYLPLISCVTCREIIRCPNCQGAISATAKSGIGSCLRCGGLSGAISCQHCGGKKFRSIISGVDRTAEEIGKAFPNVILKTISNENRNDVEAIQNQILLATPGAEPVIAYSSVVVLDSFLFLARPEGNAQIRFLRHLFNLRSMLKEKGEIIVVGDSENHILQAFLRYDAAKIGADLYQERKATKLNPYARCAVINGDWQALTDIAALMPSHFQVWGPVANTGDQIKKHQASLLISAPKHQSKELVTLLRSWLIQRSANRLSVVQIRIDPDDL